jgi:uncharacterized membrane protein YqjE
MGAETVLEAWRIDMTNRNIPQSSIRDAGAALAGLLGTRIELLGLELREEGLHLQRLIIVGVIGAFVLGAALVLAGVTVAVFFWDTHRVLALAVLSAVYATGAWAAIAWMRPSLKRRRAPFQATVREFQADLAALRETSRGTDATP